MKDIEHFMKQTEPIHNSEYVLFVIDYETTF